MVPRSGTGRPFGDPAQFEQCVQSVPIIGGFLSRWTNMKDPIVELPTVSQLKECVWEMTVHPLHFVHPEAPFDEGTIMEFNLTEMVDSDFFSSSL